MGRERCEEAHIHNLPKPIDRLGGVPGTRVVAKGQEPTCSGIATRVEQIRHLKFKRPVKEVFLSRGQFERTLEQQSRDGQNSGAVQVESRVWKEFGLLPNNTNLMRVSSKFNTQETAAFYSTRTKKLYLVSTGGKLDPLTKSYYAHELTHALQDQNFTLKRVVSRHLQPNNRDEALAIKSLIEGDAQAVQITYV